MTSTLENKLSTPITNNHRIEWIDAMRGFTMILVVYSHVAEHLMHVRCISNEIFLIFRMPLFFFISGYFSYAIYDKALALKRLKNRIHFQFLPTVIMFTIFMAIFHQGEWITHICNNNKAGYWFTLVAVEYFITYMLIEYICKKLIKGISPYTHYILLFIAFASFAIWYKLN